VSVGGFVTDGPLLLAAPVAAAAGLLSFLSPCVLPLVPGYLSFVTGLTGEDLADLDSDTRPAAPAPAVTVATTAASAVNAGAVPADASTGVLTAPKPAGPGRDAIRGSSTSSGRAMFGRGRGRGRGWVRGRGRVAAGAGLFVLGFTAVFVSYGAAFGGLGRWLTLHQIGVGRVLGAVTVVMGLAFAGLFSRLSWANREWRIHRLPPPGLFGAPALGVLFGLGWTPCLGPTLSAVLGLAVQSATAGRGAVLSAVYCLGLGAPFIVVGLAFRRGVGALAVARRHARLLAAAGGGMLVVLGLLQITGLWADLIAVSRPYSPGFAETPL
jgi:cytochrome c-type biogenesis protein